MHRTPTRTAQATPDPDGFDAALQQWSVESLMRSRAERLEQPSAAEKIASWCFAVGLVVVCLIGWALAVRGVVLVFS